MHITVRVWFNKIDTYYTSGMFVRFKKLFIKYEGDEPLYRNNDGRVVFVINDRDKLDEVVTEGIKHASMVEILIGNEWFSLKTPTQEVSMKAICGVCGEVNTPETDLCPNGHDYWIELEDLSNPELKDYINNATIPLEKIKAYLGQGVGI